MLMQNLYEVEIISSNKIEDGLIKTRDSSGTLGEILISEGYITEGISIDFPRKKPDLAHASL